MPCDTSLFLVGRRARNTKRSRSRAREPSVPRARRVWRQVRAGVRKCRSHCPPGRERLATYLDVTGVEIDGRQYDRLACRSHHRWRQEFCGVEERPGETPESVGARGPRPAGGTLTPANSKPPSVRAKCSREKLESLEPGPQPFRKFHARASLEIVARSTLKLLAMVLWLSPSP